MLDKKRERIQTDALTSWLNCGRKGTVEIITGLGKTFIAFRAMLTMPTESNILFLAETTVKIKRVINKLLAA